MFNLKSHAKQAQMPYEKYHREENLGPKADDGSPIWEKNLPHREGFEQTITEDQMKPEQEWGEKENPQIMEKELESASGSKYITHRSDAGELTMPPISVLVEKIRQSRLSDREEHITPHWSHTFDEKRQQGSLPNWSKNAPQHDKPVLNNDPERFTGSSTDPTEFHKDELIPVIGDITRADVHRVADGIKTGKAADFDAAIMAILRLAYDEKRELSEIERKTVVNLKIARTNKLMQK